MAASNPALVAGVYGQDPDPSKRFSGSDPDPSHLDGGGYHCSVVQLVAHGNGRDYSHTIPLDVNGVDPNRSSGLDTSRAKAQMILCTSRVIAAMRANDPRVRAVREVNGTLDGVTTVNYDRVLGRQNYRPDSTHLWHNHYGFLRFYMTDQGRAWAEVPGIVSVLAGESLAAFTLRTGTGTTNPTPAALPEDTMHRLALDPTDKRTVLYSDTHVVRAITTEAEFADLVYMLRITKQLNVDGPADPKTGVIDTSWWPSSPTQLKPAGRLGHLGVWQGPAGQPISDTSKLYVLPSGQLSV